MAKTLISVVFLAVYCHAADTNAPITFRYVKTGEFNNNGYFLIGTTFWATNHTTNSFIVSLNSLENKVGSNWVVQSHLKEVLRFQAGPMSRPLLGPHSAGYAAVQLTSQATGAVWRAEASIAPVLTGFPDRVARIERYPDMLRRRVQSGNTNIPVNPFATNMTYFGKTSMVYSQEISEE
jgi:hypothetical protein